MFLLHVQSVKAYRITYGNDEEIQMANKNSENPRVGREFQEKVQLSLEDYFDTGFVQEMVIPIGKPPKDHKFDIASKDKSIVVECKNYTWTDSGNVPSAKLMGLDEAVFYFSFLKNKTKILCMKKATHKSKEETLAEYYVRVHGHLLSDVSIYEVSEDGMMRIIRDGNVAS